MYIGLHVKYSLFLSNFNDILTPSTLFFEKSSNIVLHENPFSESRIVPCGRTDGQDRTDTKKIIIALCNFANAPKALCK
jgi:hypothetical protein